MAGGICTRLKLRASSTYLKCGCKLEVYSTATIRSSLLTLSLGDPARDIHVLVNAGEETYGALRLLSWRA